mmetsp:Transcript_80594/g.215142  ORF Transcript_80594/g.215142 Transcript_80594/m.215142 type:complete len:385 (-) Transcript_80594:204-1358(-)
MNQLVAPMLFHIGGPGEDIRYRRQPGFGGLGPFLGPGLQVSAVHRLPRRSGQVQSLDLQLLAEGMYPPQHGPLVRLESELLGAGLREQTLHGVAPLQLMIWQSGEFGHGITTHKQGQSSFNTILHCQRCADIAPHVGTGLKDLQVLPQVIRHICHRIQANQLHMVASFSAVQPGEKRHRGDPERQFITLRFQLIPRANKRLIGFVFVIHHVLIEMPSMRIGAVLDHGELLVFRCRKIRHATDHGNQRIIHLLQHEICTERVLVELGIKLSHRRREKLQTDPRLGNLWIHPCCFVADQAHGASAEHLLKEKSMLGIICVRQPAFGKIGHCLQKLGKIHLIFARLRLFPFQTRCGSHLRRTKIGDQHSSKPAEKTLKSFPVDGPTL